jgi:hypothetical protein
MVVLRVEGRVLHGGSRVESIDQMGQTEQMKHHLATHTTCMRRHRRRRRRRRCRRNTIPPFATPVAREPYEGVQPHLTRLAARPSIATDHLSVVADAEVARLRGPPARRPGDAKRDAVVCVTECVLRDAHDKAVRVLLALLWLLSTWGPAPGYWGNGHVCILRRNRTESECVFVRVFIDCRALY